MPDWREFDSREALDARLASDVAADLSAAIDERGSASLVVSGGSTPLGFFARLAAAPLPWEAVTVMLADERWVPADHPDSNERMVREQFLVGPAARAAFVSLLSDAGLPEDGQAEVAARLASFGSFDVVVLGMGADGHTASLFPDSAALADGLDPDNRSLCVGVEPPVAPHRRMSMTLARLLDAHSLIVHITGDEKRALIERAQRENNALELPIAAVLRSEAPRPAIYWAP